MSNYLTSSGVTSSEESYVEDVIPCIFSVQRKSVVLNRDIGFDSFFSNLDSLSIEDLLNIRSNDTLTKLIGEGVDITVESVEMTSNSTAKLTLGYLGKTEDYEINTRIQ